MFFGGFQGYIPTCPHFSPLNYYYNEIHANCNTFYNNLTPILRKFTNVNYGMFPSFFVEICTVKKDIRPADVFLCFIFSFSVSAQGVHRKLLQKARLKNPDYQFPPPKAYPSRRRRAARALHRADTFPPREQALSAVCCRRHTPQFSAEIDYVFTHHPACFNAV